VALAALLLGSGAALAVGMVHRRAARARVEWSPPRGREHHGSLHARVLGDQRPAGVAVVLLHGFMGSNRYWGGAFDQLAGSGPLVVPDLLGFGDSPQPPAGYGADDHVDAVLATLDELGVAAPLVVAGHSFGGQLALRLAARLPSRVRAVLLFGPPLFADPEAARAKVAGMDHLGGLLTLDTPAARRLCIWFHQHRRASAGLARLLRPELPPPIARDASSHTWASYWGTMEGVILAAQGEGWLAERRAPVSMVVGSEDGMVDAAYLAALAARYPGVTLRRVPGGGHDLPLTHPGLCVEEISRARADAGVPGRI
jgi:pimeloyl-ACP methyl ester carboxylesterase